VRVLEEKFYSIKASTKYIFSLFIIAIFVVLPGCGLVIWFGVYSIIANFGNGILIIVESIVLILLGIIPIILIPYVLRYHLGKIVFSKNYILLKSPIAKKIEIKWDECVSFGATCKVQSIALPSVAWLYFSKIEIDDKKAFTRAPQSNKNIIYVSVKGNMLEEMKEYMPEHIYVKIYSDLIARNYPITKN
jgi:hypothetical protein